MQLELNYKVGSLTIKSNLNKLVKQAISITPL